MSNQCVLRGTLRLRDNVALDADGLYAVIEAPFDRSPEFDPVPGLPGAFDFQVELWGRGGFDSNRAQELVDALRPIVEPCILEFVDTEMSPDSSDARMRYVVAQNDEEEKRVMLDHALDTMRDEYGDSLPLIGGKPVWEAVRDLARSATSTRCEALEATMRLSLAMWGNVEPSKVVEALRAGPPGLSHLGRSSAKTYADGWSAAMVHVWEVLMTDPNFAAVLARMDPPAQG